ncbi:hypothetical protein DIURU_003792 [Diutina rugosa]|uniref:Peptidyl-prolyl cis-trans isomerase n=1 Tax=Diutina rugosa TaxID=5481 RepID=A0A642URF4_DIURU|nr:uncharacterized protein DIURU_003792 [Diutina rugosa]KAA8900369.1 hypothetical protein DIURU_003792 [Diutina rugosa]
MSAVGLPSGWTIKISRSHNREYFYNPGSGESSWEPPFGTDEDKLKEYLRQFKQNGNRPVVHDGKVRASHLLIKHAQSRRPKSWKSPDGITLTRDEAIVKLRGFQKRILNGEIKLEELAETESDCSSHEKQGDLGYFGRGQMQPAFEEATFGLNVGEISDIIETDSGVHLIHRTG